MVSELKSVTLLVTSQYIFNVLAVYDNVYSEFESESNSKYSQEFSYEGNNRNDKRENLKFDIEDSDTDYRDDADCWMKLNATEHFKIMDGLDAKYAHVKEAYKESVGDTMDNIMLEVITEISKGKGSRAIYEAGPNKIPAGLNLGGYCMVRLKDSILFFHRMKLRNSTHFQIKYLHNDLDNMALIARLGLNDLHLMGAYERSATHKDPSVLYYRPSFGEIELLLKNVDYKMEGRLRLVSDAFMIELINSELILNHDILMTYRNTDEMDGRVTVKLQKENIDDYLQRLKADLDMWLKDYFNDFLLYYPLFGKKHRKFQAYDKQKTIALSDYANYAVNTIRDRIYELGGHELQLPQFTIYSVPNMMLKITHGVLRGMDTIYRKSVGTGRRKENMRLVDMLVGFSKLRVEYKFEAVLPNGSPPLTGQLMLNQDGMTAHLGISLVTQPDSVDLNFESIQQVKPESLTVEGPASRLIANFQHQLENQILSIMSNALMHNIKMLNTITRCGPFIYAKTDEYPFLMKTTSPTKNSRGQSVVKNVTVSKGSHHKK